MGANQSNLSESQYSYDVVVSVSQDGVNAELDKLVQAGNWPGLTTPFSSCLTVGGTGKVEGYDDAQLAAFFDFDPFSVPAGTSEADARVAAMAAAGVLFAYRATIGTSTGGATQPSWITLSSNQAPQPDGALTIWLNICFSALEILYLQRQPGGGVVVQTLRQDMPPPPCMTTVGLARVITETFTSLPKTVQMELSDLVPNSGFVVLQFNLEPGTMAFPGSWLIPGVEPTLAETAQLQASIGAKFRAMQGATPITLGYAMLPQSNAGPNDVEFQISRNSSGQPGLDTLDFLVSMQDMATPAPFGWDWLDPGQTKDAGIVAFARNTLRQVAITPLQAPVAASCLKPALSMSHDGQSFSTSISLTPDGQNATWTFPAPGQASPGPDGFVPLINVSYSQSVYDSATSEASLSSINGTITSWLSGTVGVKDNVLRGDFHVFLSYDFDMHVIGINMHDVTANVLDYRVVVDCTFVPDPEGYPVLTSTTTTTDNSQVSNTTNWGAVIGIDIASAVLFEGTVPAVVPSGGSLPENLTGEPVPDGKANMDLIAQTLPGPLKTLILYNSAWILPLGMTRPTLLDMSFSNNQDLVAHFAFPD